MRINAGYYVHVKHSVEDCSVDQHDAAGARPRMIEVDCFFFHNPVRGLQFAIQYNSVCHSLLTGDRTVLSVLECCNTPCQQAPFDGDQTEARRVPARGTVRWSRGGRTP